MRQRRHGHVRQRSAGTWEIRYTRGTDRCEGDIRKNSEDNSDVGSSHPIRGTGPEAALLFLPVLFRAYSKVATNVCQHGLMSAKENGHVPLSVRGT